jgi:hypothetical protein
MPQLELMRVQVLPTIGSGNTTVIAAPGSTNLDPGKTTPLAAGGLQVGAIKVWQMVLNGVGAVVIQPTTGAANAGGPITFTAAGTLIFPYTGAPWIVGQAGLALVFNASTAAGLTGTLYYSIG